LLNKINNEGISILMHDILSNYGSYHHKKYTSEILLFNDDYKETEIAADELLSVSRKIHLLPNGWKECPHSSIRAYFYDDTPKWLNRDYITEKYGSAVQYLNFLESAI